VALKQIKKQPIQENNPDKTTKTVAA